MKPLLLLLFAIVTFLPSPASADSLNLGVNFGFGDNFSYVGSSAGHPFVLSGGTSASFFNSYPYLPGSQFGGQCELFLYSTTIWVNGVPREIVFPSPAATLFMTSFTLPSNGQSFTMPVKISFIATGIESTDGQTIDLNGYAKGTITLIFNEGREGFPDGFYVASDFVPDSPTVVPEPSTLALICTGLVGTLVATRRHWVPACVGHNWLQSKTTARRGDLGQCSPRSSPIRTV